MLQGCWLRNGTDTDATASLGLRATQRDHLDVHIKGNVLYMATWDGTE